jgi:glycosyltransferase involved in cell wall biosynthesis
VAEDAAIYFDPLSPQDIAQTITSILNERDIVTRMQSACGRLRERYSYETIARQIAEVLTAATAD